MLNLFKPSLFLLHLLWLSLLMVAGPSRAQPTSDALEQLKEAVTDAQARTRTAGLAVAVIDPSHPQGQWILTSGEADRATAAAVSEDTLFRMGSISKMVVSMAVMSLVEQNRLSLDTPVRQLLPDMVFHNPWKASHPLRLAHLLNHASGWNAPHFIENVIHDNAPLTLREALDIYPDSRTSRWPPGTRTAYNNIGPVVAAHIVEQVTGIPFERYVKQTLFAPLQMTSSDYFYNEAFRERGATLYRGAQPVAYRDFNYRPAGGLNSNANDMLAMLRFLLRQRELPVLSQSGLSDMEKVQHTLASESGMAFGFGLGNMSYKVNGWVFHGHEGSLRGGTAMLAYQRELQVGYVVMANGEGPLVSRVHQLVSDYLTREKQAAISLPDQPLSELHQEQAGFYRQISPVNALLDPFVRLLPWRLQVTQAGAVIVPPGGAPRLLKADADGHFVQAETGLRVLIGTLDPVDGKVMHYGPNALKKISAFAAYFPLLVLLLWIVMSLLTLMRWAWQLLRRNSADEAERPIVRWSRLAVLSVSIWVGCLFTMLRGADPYQAAFPGVLNILVMLSSLAFLLMTLLGGYAVIQQRNDTRSVFKKFYGFTYSGVSLLVAMYLLSHGIIGIQLWA